MEQIASIEMPKYKCHKEVWALKIKSINEKGSGYELVFEDNKYAPIMVGQAWVESKYAQSGGYYVVYKDGYSSYSPADAFEDGYARIQ